MYPETMGDVNGALRGGAQLAHGPIYRAQGFVSKVNGSVY